jgi:DNA-binding transcriptional regulator GbsR (MarR family)
VGEIYGLLFAAVRPLPMDELMQRLRISKGSASQGLKLLRSFGAVRMEYVPGDRRDHYVAELELRHLLGGFLREKLQPHLVWGAGRLNEIDQLVTALPGDDHEILRERLARLKRWRVRGQKMLPMVLKLLRV